MYCSLMLLTVTRDLAQRQDFWITCGVQNTWCIISFAFLFSEDTCCAVSLGAGISIP